MGEITSAILHNIFLFDKAFPGTRTILMMENYRSTPQILAAANSLIAKNCRRMEKDLIPTRPGGRPVLCHHARTAEEEARWIAGEIRALREEGVPLRDIAVLYRAHYLTRTVEEVLRKAELPYTLYSGAPFFGRMEIRDAIAYLRLIAYQDDLSFLRVANVPRRNLGERRMKYLRDYAVEHRCSLYEGLKACLEDDVLRGARGKELVKLVETFSGGWRLQERRSITSPRQKSCISFLSRNSLRPTLIV